MSDDTCYELASCGLAVLADNGMILRANRTFILWSGFESAALVGRVRFHELLTKPGRMFYFTHIDPLLRMQGFVNEIACRLKGRNGSAVSVYLNFTLEKDATGASKLIHLSVFRAQDRAKYEEELRFAKERAEHLSAIVESSIDAIVSTDLHGTILSANRGFEDIFQYSPNEAVGQNLRDLICLPEHHAEFRDMLAHAQAKQPLTMETTRQRRDGNRVHVSLSMSPIRNDFGEVKAISIIYRDVTERVRAAEHIDFLMHEVNHRSKNLLAVVQGVARQTARNVTDIASYIERFSARLSAIASSHDLLVSRDWKGIGLRELACEQLRHLGDVIDTRVLLVGPAIDINPRAAEAIGLALHELSTNAVKYGALSTEQGRVIVSWSTREGDGSFRLNWTEEGGPPVAPPRSPGFGSSVLGRMVPLAVRGTSVVSYEECGLRFELRAAGADVVSPGGTG